MNETLQETPEYTPEPSQALMVQTAREVDVPSTQALTPQQARVDAVASVLHKAYERASTLQLTPEEVKALKEDFPDDAFKLGAGGNPELIYIEHAHLRDRFDAVIGMGQWALVRSRPHWAEEYVTQKGQKAVRIYADCALLIRGCFMAEAIGEMTYYPNNASQSYGDAAEGSETAAFRRCAKKIGVGLQAWKKDYCIGWTQRHKAGPAKTEYRQQVVSRIQTPPPVAKPDYDVKETPAQRKERFLAKFKGMESYAKELWIEMGIIFPTEDFSEFPEDKVPATARVVYDMVQEVKKRAGVAEPPQESAPSLPEESDPSIGEKWRDIIVPVPRKGMKRAEYLKNPDTIGSLYAARHGEDEESQTCRQRLWGLVNNYQPAGWEKRDGTKMPPSETDIQFRKWLDIFNDWFEKNHSDEKL